MREVENGIDIRSEEVQEILGTPPGWLVRWGSSIAFAVVVGFGWVSYLIRYPDKVISDIKVTSMDPPRRIRAENSLNISKILINNEDTVKTNQTLITFNAKGNFEDVLLLDKYITNLESINDSTLLYFNPPRRLILGELQESLYDFFEKQEALRQFIGSKFDDLDVQQLKLEMNNLRRAIQIDQLAMENLEEEMSIVNKRYDKQKQGVKEFVLAPKVLDQTKEKVLRLERERQVQESAIRNKEFQIQSIQNRINGVTQTNFEGQMAAQKDLEDSFNNLVNQIEDWKKSYTISSPIDGIALIPNENVKDNAYVTKDQVLLHIIPFNQGDVIGKINLQLSGSGKVREGQVVIVKFESYPFQEFGAVKGKITWKGSIPTNNSIPVKVHFPRGLITTMGRSIEPNQEMVGIAEIITADKRFIERIFESFRRSMTSTS